MNNNPLSEDVVRKRFNDAGYEIIDYTYKTNRTRMLCYDKDGYKVKVSLDSLRFNTKEYARFSPTSNSEGFMYNLKLYRSKHQEVPEVVRWEYISVGTQGKQRVLLYCKCNECGKIISVDNHFCPNCGKEQIQVEIVEEKVEEKQKVCPNCQMICEEDAKFCTGCGTELE